MKKVILLFFLLLSCKKEKKTPCICTREYNPVCAGGIQFSNPCRARCQGYEEEEMIFILSQEEIESGLLVTVECSD